MSESIRRTYHVVLMDEAEATARLIALALRKRLQCEVTIALTHSDLAEIPNKIIPDLFLVDFSPEKKEGLNICRLFKQDERTRNIPVMFFSDDGEPAIRAAAIRAGGVDYLQKPFYPEELVARVESHIQLHRSHEQILAQLNEQRAVMRVLCHDLMNPVGAVSSALQMVHLPDSMDQEFIDIAKEANDSAKALINHVRNYRVLADSEQPFDHEWFLVAEAVQESIGLLKSMSDPKGIPIKTEIGEGTRLNMNRVVLVHNILNNLLTNSIKFSHEGSPVVIRSWEEKEDESIFTHLEVEDNGIGIPENMLEHIFHPSTSISRPGTHKEKGTGFGMPLVKLYVEKGKGTLELESYTEHAENPPFRGTRIHMKFPLPSQEEDSPEVS